MLAQKAAIDLITTSLRTPLHIACNRGNLKIIQILVEAHANINAQDKDGSTPTHILSNNGYNDSLAWLLSKEPDLTLKNIYGEIAVETCANVETRKVFSMFSKLSMDDNYSRTVMKGVILHNNRADMIKSFMFKAHNLNKVVFLFYYYRIFCLELDKSTADRLWLSLHCCVPENNSVSVPTTCSFITL